MQTKQNSTSYEQSDYPKTGSLLALLMALLVGVALGIALATLGGFGRRMAMHCQGMFDQMDGGHGVECKG